MINVIGLGYIGLPTALMMASHGVEVVGTDYNKELVATLNAGTTTSSRTGKAQGQGYPRLLQCQPVERGVSYLVFSRLLRIVPLVALERLNGNNQF